MPFVALLLAVALAAPAQTGRTFLTVEAIVGSSDAVYIGAISKLEFSAAGDGFKTIEVKVEVEILDSLKGPKMKSLALEFPTRFTSDILGAIMKKGTQFLFISPPENAGVRENISGKMVGVKQETKLPYLWFRIYDRRAMDRYVDFDSNLFTADLRVLSSMPDLLKEARKAAKVYPGVVELSGFTMPNVVTRMCGDPNAYGYLVVPKDEGLKSLGRAFIEDPGKAIAKARAKSKRVYKEPKPTEKDLQELRRIGERLLREFSVPMDL